jgi:Ni/Fe-hydrogenase subunit HybB-like protein
MTLLSGFYILAYALVLSLLSYDLVMSMEPHWFSTLFAPYTFVKAFYVALAAVMILASVVHASCRGRSSLSFRHFHDLGKLLFAFCMLWADFLYVQLIVIWYGNVSEETSYVIQRTVFMPWKPVAFAVLLAGFVIPFLVLLNRKVKGNNLVMIGLCTVVVAAIWFEHLLLLGPALSPQAATLPIGIGDGIVTLGFFGLLSLCVTWFLRLFPELLPIGTRGGDPNSPAEKV